MSPLSAVEGLDVLVVDDERPALEDLAHLLGEHPGIRTVATAEDATEALDRLRDNAFHGVFLDIRMPGLSGLELARLLGHFARPPGVVFVTAYDSHAVEAFEVDAVDYLLKPVSSERLADAVRRLRTAAARSTSSGEEDPARIAVETSGRTQFVDRDAIRFVEARGDYVRLHAGEETYLLRTPISTLEEAWSEAGFVRIHRQYLLALSHITELRSRPGGGYVAVVEEHELPVSRRHARDLREILLAHAPDPRKPQQG